MDLGNKLKPGNLRAIVENHFSPHKEILYEELHNQAASNLSVHLFLWKISSERKTQRSASAAKDRHRSELQAWRHYQIRTEQAEARGII